jgi:hypothetical protein
MRPLGAPFDQRRRCELIAGDVILEFERSA